MRWWRRLVIGVLAGVMVCGVAAAQTAPVRIVQGSDGSLYLLKGGAHYVIGVDAIDDDELSTYADGGSLSGSDLVAALGGSVSPAASPRQSAPSVAQPRSVAQPATAANDSAPAAGVDVTEPAPAAGVDATEAAPVPGGAAKTSASGAGQPAATAQQPTAPGISRPGVPTLNVIKAQGAAPGGTATVTVQTTPGAACTLAYRTPAGSPSSAAGLGQQTADGNGVAAWSWPIDASTKLGLGNISVNCGNLSTTDVIQIGTPADGKR